MAPFICTICVVLEPDAIKQIMRIHCEHAYKSTLNAGFG